MLNISERYRELATAGGREPFCVIKAGDKLFFDDSIKSFELQEVIFPDELTFGTACSKRFQFKLYTDDNIPLSDEIRPYIGFGEYSEEAELCPLGVFYISRRYRRGSNYSITCYDRMYRLENTYKSSLSFPASSADLLEEICREYSLEFTGEFEDRVCEKLPYKETVRDVLGYLAGLGGGCAGFDRYGRLRFRRITDSGYRITRDNYTSMELKQDPMEVKKIAVYNDDETFVKGEGSRLYTYEVYNPFADQSMADLLYDRFGGFFYYGLELDMQGLPYLEAGDIITVQNDADDGVFTAVIGELDFTYDGSFWASLSSRSKNPVDESEDTPGQDDELKLMEDSLRMIYYSYSNDTAVNLSTALTTLAKLNIQALSYTSVTVNAQLMARAVSDCVMTLILTADDIEIPPVIRVTLKEGELFPVCIHNFLDPLSAGYVSVCISGSTDGGTVAFGEGDILMTAAGQYLAAMSTEYSPNRIVREYIPALTLGREQQLDMPFQEQPHVSTQALGSILYTEKVGLQLARARDVHFGFSDSGFAPEGVHHIRIYSKNNVVYGEIVFCNPVFSRDVQALASAFSVKVRFEDHQAEYGVSDVRWDGNRVLTVTSDTRFVGTKQVNVQYDASKGDLVCGFNGNTIGSFDVTAQVEGLL